MDSRPVRLVLATGLFAKCDNEEQWHGGAVAELAADAESALASAAGQDYELLAGSARDDMRRSLARFLSRLLLLRPDEESLRHIINQWVEAQCEMLSRLSRDHAKIRAWRPRNSLPGQVIHIEGDLSDRHDGGRSTAILTFGSGWKLVYKPREMELESWYAQLLPWLNESGAPVQLRAAEVIARDGYGWMEFVPHESCRSEQELRKYYRNAGALLCVLHLLRATDCHFENLIACGGHPVLVDAEMLFQPRLLATDSSPVTQTGLIPSFRFGPDGRTYEVSGLGCLGPQITHFEVPEWSESGIRFRPAVLTPEENVPFAEDEEPHPENYVEEIVDGFRQTYHFAAKRGEALKEKLEAAGDLPVRYLIRETIEYYAAWTGKVEAPIFLPDLQPAQTAFSSLMSDELAALRRFDIPRFTLAAASRSLHGIEDCFPSSGQELAISRIQEMNDTDLERQIHYIRLSWSFSRMARALSLQSQIEARSPKSPE
jgi:type 2 lantibiotic biosynthesis protein LanM